MYYDYDLISIGYWSWRIILILIDVEYTWRQEDSFGVTCGRTALVTWRDFVVWLAFVVTSNSKKVSVTARVSGSVSFLSESERTSEFAGVGDPVIIGLTLIGVLDPKGDRLLTADVGHFGETVQLKIDTRSKSNFQEGRSLVPTSKGRCSFSRFGLRLQVDWLRLLWTNNHGTIKSERKIIIILYKSNMIRLGRR